MDYVVAGLMQQRTDCPANDVGFISGRNDHGDPNRIRIRKLFLRRNGWIYAPKAAARKHEICPDQKTENSGGCEHFRYCTARGNSATWSPFAAAEASRHSPGNSHG